MEEYYRLTSIRHSAYMAMPYGDTEFHSGEFGNELERFLYRYDLLKAKTESIERMLPQNQKDGFFEVVKYPIFLAAFVAERSWRHRKQDTSPVRDCLIKTMRRRLQRL